MFPPPAGTVAGAAGAAAFVTVRSFVTATPAWVVAAVELSLPASSSGVPVTDAVFENVLVLVVVFAGTETTIVTVAEVAPAASVPRLQVTVAVPEHVPCDGVAETNV